MPFSVVQGQLDWSWDWPQAVGDLMPCVQVKAPFLQGLAAPLVGDEPGSGVQLRGEAVQGCGEVIGTVLEEPPGQVGRE